MIERRKGTIQRQRINPNLLNPKFKIDERSFEDLLAYIVFYVEHINFYTTENIIDGNWRALVEQDPVIYIICIIKEPIENLQEEDNLPKEKIHILLDWYNKIEKWYHTLLSFKEDVLANKIGNVLLDVLKYKKSQLETFLEKTKTKTKTTTVKSFSEALKTYVNSEKKENEFKIDLDEITHTFRKMILYIQNFTSDYLKANVFTKNDHMPNNAMYITFAILFKKVQEQINAIGQRHLDFYYKDVLQQTQDKGIATQAVVCFELLPTSKGVIIPENTQLIAGKLFESKKNIIFETAKPLLAAPIKIEALQTLFFNKSPFIKIGTSESIISNIVKNNLVSKGKPLKDVENRSLFGADENTVINSDISPKTITDIGYIIGSPVLFLEEGEREINITFTLEKETSKETFWKLLQDMVISQELPLDVIFNTVFKGAFAISYTSVTDWETINAYGVRFDEIENTFTLHFTLDNTKPPMTVLPTKTASEIDFSWPMIKVVLDEYAPIYTYSFFKGVMLENIKIDVNVVGIKNLSVYNNIGKMPLTKSFNLFGSSPTLGGYLMVGKSELFKKELTNIDLNIEWDNVPTDYGGFETYYKAYSEKFTNDSFVVDISALANGYWFPREEKIRTKVNLFDVEPTKTPEGYNSEIISKKRTITLSDLGKYQFPRDYKLEDPIPYDVYTNNGFFKFSFIAPKNTFGKNLYPKDYAEIATYNAKNEDSLPLPNKPFIPKVKQLTLDYTAKDTIYFSNAFDDSSDSVLGGYMHLTPFGVEKIVKDSRVYKNTMLSSFEGLGYLYLKLSKLETDSIVSLFFDLKNNTPDYSEQSDNIIIQYKKIDRWVTLHPKNIISDGTDQLSKSGIIEVLLPYNNEDDSNGYELRFVAKQEVYKYPIINGIYTNAVLASCTSEDETVVGKKVESYSIHKLAEKIPEIKKVVQPADSYGGKIPTIPELFYTEVSERLRHKDRALTIWDYEHLILQYFHEVIAVKCTNLDGFFKPQAGRVTLVVLPRAWKHDAHHYFNSNDLDAIHRFIKSKSNSFIRIKVRNPKVEWLLANCIVEFYAKDQGGYYLDELNKELSNYLCPLSHSDSTTIEGIGATVVPRMLRSHLENLPYIQSVKKLEIEHIVKKGLDDFTLKVYEENQEIKPTKPWSILVPKSEHKIYSSSILEDETMAEIENQNLQIGVDFIIAADDGNNEKALEVITSNKVKDQESTEQALTVKKSKLKANTILTFKIK
ncbi:hypothetical protein A8C32_05150 [Flavivirga aquatica]|uniref:Baseplate protein J-like domain-containing protein n=1 Tax=Flavivirga aquatica TaxID=1849968 RepID=A0A1E5SHK1_9FLAO|nr:hypothetical protein [Flavivirga aquatica]OEJ98588.1 hypothetical protein A8C32_05150 [Flavivirga aquatica]